MSTTMLIDAATLTQHLDDPAWRIFDVRHDLMDHAAGRRAYGAGHIPGAVFADIETELSGIKTGRNGRHPLPEREAMAEQFRAWGISNSTRIVAYDAQGGQFAVRLWWLARWLGHTRVVLLDGGWPAWTAAGGAISTEPPRAVRGTFETSDSLMPLVDSASVLALLGSNARLLVDARTPERFRGEVEPIDPVAGHIPGARNRFFKDNLGEDGRFKPAAELRVAFDLVAGGRLSSEIVSQCGSGVTACHNLLAMEIAGLSGARLYPGSWSEWCSDPRRPIATS
jgi:thiosulfate/3-mercaptopyruvate sulfurtransferase